MCRLATDSDFNGDILRALRAARPEWDVVRVQDVGLMTAPDPDVLEWAAAQGRVLLSHDRNSMTDYAYERMGLGLPMAGLVIVRNQASIGPLVEDILIAFECSLPDEWPGKVDFLPY